MAETVDKAYLLENQILYQIKELRAKKARLKKEYNAGDLSFSDWNNQDAMCYGAISQLTIVITAYDNPLSNFESKKKKMNGSAGK